jgi:hypothetical protein
VEAIHEAGDHRLWIGRVEYMEFRDGDPLIFYAGKFVAGSHAASTM